MLCYTQDDANAEGGMYNLQHFFCPQNPITNQSITTTKNTIMMIYYKQIKTSKQQQHHHHHEHNRSIEKNSNNLDGRDWTKNKTRFILYFVFLSLFRSYLTIHTYSIPSVLFPFYVLWFVVFLTDTHFYILFRPIIFIWRGLLFCPLNWITTNENERAFQVVVCQLFLLIPWIPLYLLPT